MSICENNHKYNNDFYRNLAEGRIPGICIVNDFGHNEDIGTTRETLHAIGGDYYWLPSAQQLQISSDSGDDTIDGTGAQKVEVVGLDGDFKSVSEELDMNGINVVTTTESFRRVNYFEVAQAGSGESNADQVYLKDNDKNNTIEVIGTGKGRSHSATFTTPANQQCYVVGWHGSEISNKGIKIELWKRNIDVNVWQSLREAYLLAINFDRTFLLSFSIAEKTDLQIQVIGLQSGAKATGGFEGYCMANEIAGNY